MYVCMFSAVYTYMFVCAAWYCMCVSVWVGVCWASVCLTGQWVRLLQFLLPLFLSVSCSLSPWLSFSLPLSINLSLSLILTLSPSSSLCNNSADLVSACSELPVEFYSGLPSWLLCCLKTQAEKHDWGFFSWSHHYSLILSRSSSIWPKQIGLFWISNNKWIFSSLMCKEIAGGAHAPQWN